MNKQGNKSNPSGGIEWTHIFGPGTGYTANPVRGCQHQCRWRMVAAAPRRNPGDEGVAATALIPCYAESQRDRLDGKGAFQNVTFHPEILDAIRRHKTSAGIFIDSMSDLFATAVKDEWIRRVFETMEACPQHRFFSLTKNPTRLCHLPSAIRYPQNLLLGVSLPPTFMFGKELTEQQQRTWFDKALASLVACDARVRWVSLEPLSWDCSDILRKYAAGLDWAVIGAASDGPRYYQPAAEVFNPVYAAVGHLPVFYKGNLRPFIDSQNLPWRQEFPIGVHQKPDNLERTEELFAFLQGKLPEGYKIPRAHRPKLTADQAWTVIWYLGNQYWRVTDHIERCEICGELFDTHSGGDCLDYGKAPYHFCDNCMASNEYARKAADKRNPDNAGAETRPTKP